MFSRDENYVMGTDEASNSVIVWDAKTGDVLKKFVAHNDTIRYYSKLHLN